MIRMMCGVRLVMVITTAQLHSTKPELRFCTGSNSARSMSEIHNDEDLWQWSWLEIRLNAFRWSSIPQKQFIIIIIGQSHLQFYGHVIHWDSNFQIQVMKLEINGKKKKNEPRKLQEECLKKNLEQYRLRREDTSVREKWQE